uniref:Reverse transcriptase domain-containing protein n=1 Tax=Amphimedon queenslandica TaxID=400682 RepID=A0A1X7VC22_AMPQE
MEATIHVPPNVQARFYSVRLLPYAIKVKVEQELNRFQKAGVITSVEFPDWAAPVVPVVKSNGSLRICGDYTVIVNALDLTHAYQQLHLSLKSQKYATINTSKGIFYYERLRFGISLAPGICQCTTETLLKNFLVVVAYIDDLLVTGSNKEQHLQNFDRVMTHLKYAAATLKRSKNVFLTPSVECLGQVIDNNGLHPSQEKVCAIQEAPEPTNVSELKSVLGLINT